MWIRLSVCWIYIQTNMRFANLLIKTNICFHQLDFTIYRLHIDKTSLFVQLSLIRIVWSIENQNQFVIATISALSNMKTLILNLDRSKIAIEELQRHLVISSLCIFSSNRDNGWSIFRRLKFRKNSAKIQTIRKRYN